MCDMFLCDAFDNPFAFWWYTCTYLSSL